MSEAAPPEPGYSLRMACLCRVQGDCTVILSQHDVVVETRGTQSLPAYDGANSEALGIAVDIGTTTVAMQLYHLPSGRLLAQDSALNAQASFGADVLSRIAFSDQHGLSALHRELVDQLSGMMQATLRKADADAGHVERVVATGNTTMLHFLTGLDPHGIGIAPFIPSSFFGDTRPAAGLFPFLPTDAELYLPRCVGAYVGADITCDVLASGLMDRTDATLLVDVGTNGEMALRTKDRLLCCATAAGPAFEGAQISMGMTAAQGAICRVNVLDGLIAAETIGGRPARGVCGTGLISAVRAMLSIGALDPAGTIEPDGHAFSALVEDREDDIHFHLGSSGVTLSGRDIREVQLAKAAIAAGIDTLLHEAGYTLKDVASLVLAGGFGSVIDPAEAAAIGLIPRALADYAQAGGNLALAGAAAMLFSKDARKASEQFARKAQEISLSSSAYFMEKYMDHMFFPEEE